MSPNTVVRAPIAVVIRNLNEAKSLRKVLVALRCQTHIPAEIIVVDNESTDDSRDVISEFHARLVSLPRNAFTYGRALNVGINEASQPFILNLSAHSIPLGRTFIEDVLEPFGDPRVGAVRCRDVAKKEDLADWPQQRRLNGGVEWQTLFNQGLINSAAAIRRDLWLQFPFDEELPFSEDTLWSRKVLGAGQEITTSAAMYVYLRDHNFLETMQRRDREGIATYEISGLRPSYSVKRFVRAALVGAPRAALRVLAYECLLCASTLTVSFRARSKPHKRMHDAALSPPNDFDETGDGGKAPSSLQSPRNDLVY